MTEQISAASFQAGILRKLQIERSVLEKLENVPRFEMDLVLDLTMCLADFTCVNGSTI